MAKKLILIIAALFGVSLLCLIFIYMNKDLSNTTELYQPPVLDTTLLDENSGVEDIKAGEITFGKSEGIIFHVPGKREFGYEKRVSHPGGMFQILNPWVKLYSDNNIIRITAQQGLMPLEREGDTLSGSGPDHGILEGDVSIEVFRKPADISYNDFQYEAKYKELAVKLGKTKFEREFSRIIGEGQVKVISEQFLATGNDLIMQYDQINKKLQLLEITQMRKLIVTMKKGVKQESPLESSASKPDTVETLPPADFMTYYLNLSDSITVQTEQETFTADNLEIMADVSSGSKLVQKNSQHTGNGADNNLIANNSIDKENYRIITMTCNGPLVITSPQETYHAQDGLARIKITASGEPVEIYRKGLLALKADQVIYSRNTNNQNHDIKMIAKDKYSDLFLAQGNQQTISASEEIAYDFNSGIASLAGPGVINSLINDTDKSKIEFNDKISIKFADPIDDDNNTEIPLNSERAIDWIECVGTVRATLKEGFFTADKTRINFNTTDAVDENNKASMPAIENMIMNGNVTMSQDNSKFNCGKLILRFRTSNGKTEPGSLWASNNVIAENDTYLIKAPERILINFGKARSSVNTESQNDDSVQTAFSDMSNLFENLNPVYVIAEGNNNDVLFRNKVESYEVRGNSIEGKLPNIDSNFDSIDPALAISSSSNNLSKDGIWTIKGLQEKDDPTKGLRAVVQLSQARTVSGMHIELDQANGFCSIPGSGSLNLVSSANFSKSSMPVNIKWSDGVVYSISNNVLALKDAIFEIDTLRDEKTLQTSRLYANNVDVELSKASNELTSFRAFGPDLRLISSTIDLSNNDLLSQSQLSSQQITFSNLPRATLVASGGGWLEHVILCTPDQIDNTNESDIIAELEPANPINNITGQNGYYFLQFTQAMALDIENSDITFADPIAIHYLPMADTATPEVAVNDDNSLSPGGFRIFCDSLKIANSINDKSKIASDFITASGNTNLISSIGNGQLGYAFAKGSIFMEHKAENGSEHFFSADSLLYDTQNARFCLSGDEYTPARFDQLQFEYLNYDLATSSYNGKTWGQSGVPGK